MRLTKDTLIEGEIVKKGTSIKIKEMNYGFHGDDNNMDSKVKPFGDVTTMNKNSAIKRMLKNDITEVDHTEQGNYVYIYLSFQGGGEVTITTKKGDITDINVERAGGKAEEFKSMVSSEDIMNILMYSGR
ncbi:unnamed protein product [marine sediment metagenome]|uniref:Uncharacterized protein n=1 Tax=marine sediment metagenome TaxID=412755 RepID=X0U2C2_9ZZZZ